MSSSEIRYERSFYCLNSVCEVSVRSISRNESELTEVNSFNSLTFSYECAQPANHPKSQRVASGYF